MNKTSGYIEIPLPDGSKKGLKFGMWTFRELSRRWNIPFEEIINAVKAGLKDDGITVIIDMISASAEYASGLSGKPEKYSDFLVSSWIDDGGGLDVSPIPQLVMSAFMDAMGLEFVPGSEIAEDPKNEIAEPQGNEPAPKKGLTK